ncbi:hypothetical protein [Methylomicrobium lacus]|uniref:hypothetical protein n=1 Tax=Methylomicrobium lacus TaxID=136992 RepID=UPI0035A91AAD
MSNLAKNIGPLTWAYAIIIGGVLLLTPGGIGPIVTKIAGALGIALGAAGFYIGRTPQAR